MPRCEICKKKLDSQTAYCVEVLVNHRDGSTGITKKYYCNKQEYDQREKQKRDRDNLYRVICEIFGVKEIINSALWKEKEEWNKKNTDYEILSYLLENKDKISKKMSEISGSEFGRIRYFSAILKNNLGDYIMNNCSKITDIPNYAPYPKDYNPVDVEVSNVKHRRGLDNLMGDFYD